MKQAKEAFHKSEETARALLNASTESALLIDLAEKKLQEGEDKYRSLFHHSNNAIFIHDLDGNIIDVNQKAVILLGYTNTEIFKINVSMLHPTEAAETSRQAFETILRDGSVNFEIKFKKKDGSVFLAEVSSSLFTIGGKQVVQGIARDITERKRAEKALFQERDKLQEAIAQIKTLSGMLPICSSCKKIRDDKGYWNQIESYIQDHSDVGFSHGICPDCAKKLYPDLDIF
ncbi:MAG: PAS domain S-box protein, partial [Desulfobacteraceae bacterium]|nr:PAS domain S-box protein [Desulfobacteraceae bacterium]